MQIVIDIPEYMFEDIQDRYRHPNKGDGINLLEDAVAKGTPLPEDYGRLIDADELIKAIEEKSKRLKNPDTINGLCGAVALIYDANTIIEANKVES